MRVPRLPEGVRGERYRRYAFSQSFEAIRNKIRRREVNIDGQSMSMVEVRGSGPDIFTAALFHGLSGNASHFFFMLPYLEPHFGRIFIPNIPGDASNPFVEGVSDIARRRKDLLLQLLQNLNQEVDGKLHVTGHSFGGTLALAALAEAPELFDSMALLAPAMAPCSPEERDKLKAVLTIATVQDARRFLEDSFSDQVPRWARLKARSIVRSSQHPVHQQLIDDVLAQENFDPVTRDKIRNSGVNGVLLMPEQDRILPASTFATLDDFLPPTMVRHTKEGLSHALHLTHPKMAAGYVVRAASSSPMGVAAAREMSEAPRRGTAARRSPTASRSRTRPGVKQAVAGS